MTNIKNWADFSLTRTDWMSLLNINATISSGQFGCVIAFQGRNLINWICWSGHQRCGLSSCHETHLTISKCDQTPAPPTEAAQLSHSRGFRWEPVISTVRRYPSGWPPFSADIWWSCWHAQLWYGERRRSRACYKNMQPPLERRARGDSIQPASLKQREIDKWS